MIVVSDNSPISPVVVQAWISQPPDWLVMQTVDVPSDSDLDNLDPDERAAIVLAVHRWLLAIVLAALIWWPGKGGDCPPFVHAITNFDITIVLAVQHSTDTMNVSLTPELEKLVHEKVKSGRYLCASDVIREGLRLLEERDRLYEMRLAELIKKLL